MQSRRPRNLIPREHGQDDFLVPAPEQMPMKPEPGNNHIPSTLRQFQSLGDLSYDDGTSAEVKAWAQINGVSKPPDGPRLVCYRRNYISVELNVTISPHLLSKDLIFTCDDQRRRISHFGVGISARSSKGQSIRLIQSISGRNGPPVAPKIMEINPIPATAVDVQSIRAYTIHIGHGKQRQE
ncbi:hypothetical protein PG995_004846 [Apiospora arundinis]